MPQISFELWQLLLNSGVGGLALVILLIFIPFLCGIFWLIFRQQNAVTSMIINSVVTVLNNIAGELKGVNEQLEVQTHILTNLYSPDPKRNKIVQLSRIHHGNLSNVGEKDTAG